MSAPLWQPSAEHIQATRLSAFIRHTRRSLLIIKPYTAGVSKTAKPFGKRSGNSLA